MTAPVERPSVDSAAQPRLVGRFAALDGFRSLAAIGVVVYHVAGYSQLTSDGSFGAGMLGNLGNFGVAVFFLLSGFLLYRPFVVAHLQDRPSPRWAPFYWNRLLRIFPGYWLALTVFLLIVGTAQASPKLDYYLTLYTLTQNYRPYFGASGLTVAWTLCIEVSFYLALPMIAVTIRAVIGAKATSPRTRMQAQLLGLAALVLICWVYRLLVVPLSSGKEDNFHLWLPNYLDWFALGMVLAVAVVWSDLGHRLPRVVRVLAGTPWVCWVLALWTYVILSLLRGSNAGALTGTEKESVSEAFLRFGFNGVAAFFLLLPAVLGVSRPSRIRTVMSSRAPAYLGTVSFGIYLWHKIWLDWSKGEGRKAGDAGGFGPLGDNVRAALSAPRRVVQETVGTSFWPLLGAVLVFTLITAAASWHGLERPVLRFKRLDRRA